MRKCANIKSYLRRPSVIYDFATAPFWISLYVWKFFFFFFSVQGLCTSILYPTVYGKEGTMQNLVSKYRDCGVYSMNKTGSRSKLSVTWIKYRKLNLQLLPAPNFSAPTYSTENRGSCKVSSLSTGIVASTR